MLTAEGAAVGTLAYMSPEQLRGDEVDARTDVFSLGLVLFQMATGRPAFAGATGAVVAAAILHEKPQTPSTLRPELTVRFDEIVLKALEKDRTLRYTQAADLRADLQRLKRDTDGTATAAVGRAAPAPARRGMLLLTAGALLAIAAIGGGYWYSLYSRRPAPLTDKETVVLADFANTTGDPVFDDTLRQGLAIQLQQSTFLSLTSDTRIQQLLGLMGQPAGAKLTPAIARDICERMGGGAILEGSIASLGAQYVLGVRATGCRSGEVLGEEQEQVAKKEDVLNALSDIASRLRVRLGESLSTLDEHNRPLPDVSTASLDALKAYSAGLQARGTRGGLRRLSSSSAPSRSTTALPWRTHNWEPRTASAASWCSGFDTQRGRSSFATGPPTMKSSSSRRPIIARSPAISTRRSRRSTCGHRPIRARSTCTVWPPAS